MIRVIHVTVSRQGGSEYQLDTPDSAMIGTWLKSLFDSWQGPAPSIPTRFTVEIS